MQSTGIVRKLDSLGRITLPMELRKSFDIGEREPLEIFTEEDKIIIKKYNPSDIFTGQCEAVSYTHLTLPTTREV